MSLAYLKQMLDTTMFKCLDLVPFFIKSTTSSELKVFHSISSWTTDQ